MRTNRRFAACLVLILSACGSQESKEAGDYVIAVSRAIGAIHGQRESPDSASPREIASRIRVKMEDARFRVEPWLSRDEYRDRESCRLLRLALERLERATDLFAATGSGDFAEWEARLEAGRLDLVRATSSMGEDGTLASLKTRDRDRVRDVVEGMLTALLRARPEGMKPGVQAAEVWALAELLAQLDSVKRTEVIDRLSGSPS